MQDQLINLLIYTVPAVVTGVIAYFFFKEHIKNENNRRHFLMHKDFKKEALPMRLQAYERMTLFLERIVPSKLLIRVAPLSSDKNDYERLLIDSIEQEFEHNLSQQIYLTSDCWSIILAAKNTTIQLILKANMSEKTDNANKLREVILTEMMEKQAPSSTALAYIKEEISAIW
ncbi:hypothetical protein ES677_01105 [Bizionia gelidisalsuginis]|uniref:DUF2726 domain-containing protein n=1 Tax=Bizionia gelidisalsuginis TaxID=291188 RepID=A0ABY3MEG7_9FLAO|nr:hypothetical protein [Bizionia gelidisalsuginis]TYC18004.1 hypothetical protein ES677_01105 [Bizionia gelidisalsuginis]